jgi:hypothetical protein
MRIIALLELVFILAFMSACSGGGIMKPLKFYDGIAHRQDGNPN